MKTGKFLLAALLLVASPAAWAQSQSQTLYTAGTNQLAITNINAALSDFTNAAGPANPDADLYAALTRLLALPNDSVTSMFLGDLNISPTGRNVYHWKAKPHTNSNGHTVLPISFNPDDITAEVRSDVVPTLIASEANLAEITDTTFALSMPRSVTHFGGDVTVDYGDVQMLRAMADSFTVFGYTINTWNLNANYGTASNIIKNQQSIEALLTNYKSLLTTTNAGDFALGRSAFTNAVSRYMAASQFIRSRPAGQKRLFNLDDSDLQTEQNFRTTLSNLQNSLSAPVALHSNSNHMISLASFFGGGFNVRSFLPAFASKRADFIWDSFADTTLGGVISGLTQTNLGKVFLKFGLGAELNLPGVVCTVVSSATGSVGGGSLNGVVQGADGSFYGTSPYGGNNGYGAIFKATSSGGFTLLYSFGNVTDMNGNPLDGGNPSSLVLGSDHNFYGTTQFGGDNGNGTIFKLTPGVTATLKTLYSFGQNSDSGANGGNPLLLGKDGNFYGTTQTGGDGGGGIIFQFVPGTGVGGNNGVLTTLYSFPSSNGSNPNGNGAGAGALVQGSDGNFYGVTQFGGDYGGGSAFQYVPNGNQFYSYSFPLQYDSYGNPITLGVNTLVQGSNGIFYGTTQYGGNNFGNGSMEGDGSIFCIDTQGNFTNLYSFDENNYDGYGPIGALVQGTNGDFFGITSGGGGNDRGTVFRFRPGGATDFLVWFNENLGKQQGSQNNNNGGGGFYYNSTVTEGLIKGTGGFYGTAPDGGGNGDGTVFVFNTVTAPSIVTSPVSTTNLVGASVVFTVSANNATSYKWIKGTALLGNSGTHVTGATTASLTINGLTLADAGNYFAVVSNPNVTITSAVAVLTVVQGATITSQPATPVNLLQGQVLSLKVGAGGGGPYTYQWLDNNGPLSNIGNISGSATSNLVVNPVFTRNSGSYTVIVANAIGPVTSRASVVTVAADTVIPAVTITSPAAGARSNAPVTFRGTASDNVQVTNVNYWITNLNGSPLLQGQAVLSPGPGAASPSNWTVNISPAAGSNVFAVQSQDFSGNLSHFVSIKFFLKSPVPLPVAIAGTGNGTAKGATFTAGDTAPTNGALLNVGESYSITATTGSNSFFVNWTGTAATNGATLDFLMQSNTSLTANFITNMFVQMAGTYNGLFSSATLGVPTEETAGMIGNLKLTGTGAYTATVNLAGSSPSISGTFTHDGFATNTGVLTTLDGKVTVELMVNPNSAPRTITGTVIGTNNILVNGVPTAGWTSGVNLIASLANTRADAGTYTMLIPPTGALGAGPLLAVAAGLTPPGYGYALLTNNPGTTTVPATVTLTGMLADGTTISQTVPIGEDNGIPVYVNPYTTTAPGLVFGRLNLSSSPTLPVPSGDLAWIRKASASGLFKAGFTNPPAAVQGSFWSNAIPFFPPFAQLTISGGGLTVPLTVNVTLNKTNLIGTTPNYASGSINTNNGQLTITFTNNSRIRVTGYGALLQDGLFGDGFFASPAASPTNVGSISLLPVLPGD